MVRTPVRGSPLRASVWVFHMALPLLGLWLLIARPGLDGIWENHLAHFWLVVGTAAVNVAVGLRMSEATRRRNDARLFLVSLAFLSSAGFLLLHALATPQVLLSGKNGGFIAGLITVVARLALDFILAMLDPRIRFASTGWPR
jgi:adenylate cyclase